ncbi:MAG: SpoIIIAC/SpoIIIAD family protein [Oscillospiraceae bacterium]
MDIISVALFCITSCVLLKVLASNSGEIKVICSILAACLVTVRFLSEFSSISSALSELFEQTGLNDEYFKIIVKCLGICYVTQLGCDCCRDCGEAALASQLELTGKASMLIVSLPLFRAAVELVRSLLM